MKNTIVLLLAFLTSVAFAERKNIIFDTDIGGDIDDSLALVQTINYVQKGKANLLCVSAVRNNWQCVAFSEMLLMHYGCGNVPVVKIGKMQFGVSRSFDRIKPIVFAKNENGSFKYPRKTNEKTRIEDAVRTHRRLLANSPDNSVYFVSLGTLHNFANLLSSTPDDISVLNGRELVAKKVKLASIMAGDFSGRAWQGKDKGWVEYNLRGDKGQMLAEVLKLCDVPIVFSGYEVGRSIRFPQSEIEKLPLNNPLREAYLYYSTRASKTGKHDRPLWDPTSVLFVFAPELFELSKSGVVSVDETGVTYFKPDQLGKHRYLIIKDDGTRKKILQRIINDVVSAKQK